MTFREHSLRAHVPCLHISKLHLTDNNISKSKKGIDISPKMSIIIIVADAVRLKTTDAEWCGRRSMDRLA